MLKAKLGSSRIIDEFVSARPYLQSKSQELCLEIFLVKNQS